jgi:hypothetical protein
MRSHLDKNAAKKNRHGPLSGRSGIIALLVNPANLSSRRFDFFKHFTVFFKVRLFCGAAH